MLRKYLGRYKKSYKPYRFPKLNKYEINKIIDEVEREVKFINKSDHKGFAKNKNDKSSKIKPEEYWNRVKRVNNKSN